MQKLPDRNEDKEQMAKNAVQRRTAISLPNLSLALGTTELIVGLTIIIRKASNVSTQEIFNMAPHQLIAIFKNV